MKKLVVILLVFAALVGGGGLGAVYLYREGYFDPAGGSTFLVQVLPGEASDGSLKPVSKESVDRAIKALELRLDSAGEPMMRLRSRGEDRIEIHLPMTGEERVERVRAVIEQRDTLEFRLVRGEEQRIGCVVLPVKQVEGKPNDETELRVTNHADFAGKYVKKAFAILDPNKGWMIILRFDAEGTKLFGELTGAHTHERLAMVVNGEVISAPVLRDAITIGTAEISGRFTEREAKAVAAALETPLENPLKVLSVDAKPVTVGKSAP